MLSHGFQTIVKGLAGTPQELKLFDELTLQLIFRSLYSIRLGHGYLYAQRKSKGLREALFARPLLTDRLCLTLIAPTEPAYRRLFVVNVILGIPLNKALRLKYVNFSLCKRPRHRAYCF